MSFKNLGDGSELSISLNFGYLGERKRSSEA